MTPASFLREAADSPELRAKITDDLRIALLLSVALRVKSPALAVAAAVLGRPAPDQGGSE